MLESQAMKYTVSFFESYRHQRRGKIMSDYIHMYNIYEKERGNEMINRTAHTKLHRVHERECKRNDLPRKCH